VRSNMADFNFDPFSQPINTEQAPPPDERKAEGKKARRSPNSDPPPSFNPYIEETKRQAANATVDMTSQMAYQYARDRIPTGCTKVFKIEFYRSLFACQTSDIMKRVWQSLLIFKGDFLNEAINGPVDLWYPIWVTITLVFALFLGMTIDIVFNINGNGNVSLQGSLPFITLAGLIAAYQGLVPLIFWAVCKCIGFTELRYTVISCLYSYSYTLLVPLCVVLGLFRLADGKKGTATENLGSIIAGGVFGIVGAWAMLFFVVQLIKYLKKLDVGKKSLMIMGLLFGIVHGGFFAAIICIFLFANF
ncbi:Putative Yip1 domain protein, partial [Giardia duodenalis]